MIASRAARVLAVSGALLVACGADQDPGVTVDSSGGGSTTTSRLLAECPPGGPDTTTPAAGCLGPDGEVLKMDR